MQFHQKFTKLKERMAVLVNRTASVKKIGCAFLNFLPVYGDFAISI